MKSFFFLGCAIDQFRQLARLYVSD
jgi:hypothetical protein